MDGEPVSFKGSVYGFECCRMEEHVGFETGLRSLRNDHSGDLDTQEVPPEGRAYPVHQIKTTVTSVYTEKQDCPYPTHKCQNEDPRANSRCALHASHVGLVL